MIISAHRLTIAAALALSTAAAAAPTYSLRMNSPGVVATPVVPQSPPAAPSVPAEPAAPTPTPPQPDSTTALLLHMNGVPGSSNFVDAKGNGITALGGAAISASYPVLGNGAASFNGASQALAFSNQVFNFGAQDYTVEAWVRPSGGGLQTVLANSWGWQLYWGNASLSLYVSASATGPAYYSGMPLNSAAGSVPAGAWSHIAVVRSGSVLSLYTNGQLAKSIAFTGAQVAPVFPASVGTIYTSDAATSYYFAGQIDEVRVTKGLARYTSNFTPAVQEFTP